MKEKLREMTQANDQVRHTQEYRRKSLGNMPHSSRSIHVTNNNNKENQRSNNPNESLPSGKKNPIDNLHGYWEKMKNKRTSRTRNSNCLNSVQSIGSKISLKRCHTSLNGSDSGSFMRPIDDPRPSYRNNIAPLPGNGGSNYRRDEVSLSSKFANDLRESKRIISNSTYLELESESEKDQTPVKAKITTLERNTKEKNNLILKETYNTVDDTMPESRNKLGCNFSLEGKTFDNQYEAHLDEDTFEQDEEADIDDS